MLQRDGVMMVEMKMLVMRMMVMMIPMKSSAMMMMMAMIYPLREGISLADFCLLESFSLSGVFCSAEAAVCISEPPSLRFLGKMKYAKGRWQMWARAATQQASAARGRPAPPVCVPALWLLSSPPFGFLGLLAKYNFLVFF
jgi:hypothetical protein